MRNQSQIHRALGMSIMVLASSLSGLSAGDPIKYEKPVILAAPMDVQLLIGKALQDSLTIRDEAGTLLGVLNAENPNISLPKGKFSFHLDWATRLRDDNYDFIITFSNQTLSSAYQLMVTREVELAAGAFGSFKVDGKWVKGTGRVVNDASLVHFRE
jgi:hypothetical protein